jgi:cytochrome b subunit of formate dehydrogenase
MSKKPAQVQQQQRQQLVDDLARNILESARPLIDPDTAPEQLEKVAAEISERLQFESSVALNEVVTRFAAPGVEKEEPERTFLRFGWNFRLQHMLMFTSVILLIITGMPLKFPDYALSKFVIIDIFGGLQNSSLIHRIGAGGLIIVGFWHMVYVLFSRIGRRDFVLLLPRWQDIKNFFQTALYFMGRRASGPKFGRFSFIEKFDYWAVYWGMVIMIGSGVVLWFKEFFPKYGYDIAREAHSDEGLLATLAIVIWHFYNVHFNPDVFPMSWVWWHGRLTESEMKHHHALEYADIIGAEGRRIEKDREQVRESEESAT